MTAEGQDNVTNHAVNADLRREINSSVHVGPIFVLSVLNLEGNKFILPNDHQYTDINEVHCLFTLYIP